MFADQPLDLGVHGRRASFPDFVGDRRARDFERLVRGAASVASETRFVPIGPDVPVLFARAAAWICRRQDALAQVGAPIGQSGRPASSAAERPALIGGVGVGRARGGGEGAGGVGGGVGEGGVVGRDGGEGGGAGGGVGGDGAGGDVAGGVVGGVGGSAKFLAVGRGIWRRPTATP